MLNNTFARWHTTYEPTITGCYFVATTNLPTNQGIEPYVYDAAPANLGDLVWDYGVLTTYQNGILYDGKYYVEVSGIALNAATLFGESKYVTSFYSGTRDHQLPENAKAYTMSLDGGKVVFHQIGDDGRVIPHGTAVVIVSSESSANLRILDSTDVTPYGGNILRGSDTAIDTAGTVYVLGIVGESLGFYQFTGSTIPAGKAYYLK